MPPKPPGYLKEFNLLKKLGLPYYPTWRQVLALEKKTNGERFLRLYGWKQSFRISNIEQLAGVFEALKVGAEELGWGAVGNPVIKEQLEKIEKLKSDKAKYKTEIDRLYAEMLKYKVERLTTNIPIYKENLGSFRALLKKPNTEESDMQDWLKQHTWMLGTEYMDSQPINDVSQFSFDDSRFDFFLQRFDTGFDIIELKKPDANLFRGDRLSAQESVSRGTPMASGLSGAVSQMIHYLDLARHKRKALLKEMGIDVYYPRGVIIIGRTHTKDDVKRLRSVNAYLRDINMLSYDMLQEKTQTLLKHLERKIAVKNTTEAVE